MQRTRAAAIGVLASALSLALTSAHAAPPSRAPAVELPPDPAVEDAGDANLEPTAHRRGVTIAVALGGGLLVGFGIDGSAGRGGAIAVRVGHVATRRTVITFEAAVTAALHRPATMSTTRTNTNSNLLAGAQYYVNPSFWLRGAAGVGVYQAREVPLEGGTLGNATLVGPALLGGAGIDIVRWKSTVLGFEVATSAMVNRDGVLVSTGAGLGLAFD